MQSSPKHIASLLQDLIKDNGWEYGIASGKFPDLWYAILGNKGHEISEFKRFEDGKLFIHVHNAPWRSELTLRKHELIQKLNEKAGIRLVQDIIFR